MRTVLLSLWACLSMAVMADHHLSADQALQRIGLQTRSVSAKHRAPAASHDLYYVFNLDEGGYVIASADDRARAILGRTDSGEWNPDQMPPAMRGWLESMEEALSRLASSQEEFIPTPPKCLQHKAAATRVEPLLGDITWGQGEPYFNECPAIGSSHSATGCAATAMAQIMRYHKYPEHGIGSNSYVSETIKFNVNADFSQTTYDWANMKPSYPISANGQIRYYTEEEATAVARLMFHLGAASNMDYNTGASGTTEAPMLKAMINHFGYDQGLQIYYRDYFTSQQWYELLQSEIDAKRPVLMNGFSISGGHAFVIDGYDTKMGNGYFHFNWGWNGMSNGYYSVDITDPGQQGTGGSLGGYSYNQNIFVGIQPPTNGTKTTAHNLCVTEALKYAKGEIYFAFRNRAIGLYTGEVGYAVEQNGNTSFTALGTLNGAGFNQGGNYHFNPNITQAGARVYAAYRENGVVKPMQTIVGTASALISTLTNGKISYEASTNDLPQLRVESIELTNESGVAYVGYTTTFRFSVTNLGTTEYNGPLYLCINELDSKGNPTIEEYHTSDNPLGVFIRPGETNSYELTYYDDPHLIIGRYSAQVIYNPRNSSSFVHIPGAKAVFDVELYKAPTPQNPPKLKLLSQELSSTTVEQGKLLTLRVKVENTGGTDAVSTGGIIYQKKGSSPKAYLGEKLISFPVGESEWSFTGPVNVEPGSYRLLAGNDNNGWWEPWSYDYIYFDVTENTTPIDTIPTIDPDTIPGGGTDTIPEITPTDTVFVHLPLDDVFANYYSDAKFSKPGAYDYFFNYGNLEDEDGFPWLLFHILQPTNTGICEGTYSMSNGTLRALILRSMDDYNTYKAGFEVNPLKEATVTMTQAGEDLWRMQFKGVGRDGEVYDADVTLPVTAKETKDTNDPMIPNSGGTGGGGGGGEPIIPSVVEIPVNYCEVELWTNPNMSPAGHYDYYFQMVQVDNTMHASDYPYVEFDLYLPFKGCLQQGTYKFDDKFCNFVLNLNNEDRQATENFEDNYGFHDGSLTLIDNGNDNWTIEVEMIAEDGTLYLINLDTDIKLRWRDEDPWNNPGVNDTFNKEPTEAGNYTVALDLIETSEEFLASRGFFYVNLESSRAESNGSRFVSEFYFRAEPDAANCPAGTYRIPAGTYLVNYDDDSHLTFVASHGDGLSGGRYPSYIGLYNGKGFDSVWYLSSGTITVSYDAVGKMLVEGNVKSHYGSRFHFSTDPTTAIRNISAEEVEQRAKFFRNHQVILRNAGREYNLKGHLLH